MPPLYSASTIFCLHYILPDQSVPLPLTWMHAITVIRPNLNPPSKSYWYFWNVQHKDTSTFIANSSTRHTIHLLRYDKAVGGMCKGRTAGPPGSPGSTKMQAKIRRGNYSNCVLNVLPVNMSLLLPLVLDPGCDI